MSENRERLSPRLRLVAWEVTRRCNLLCAHCRASAVDEAYADELGTEACLRIVDEIVEVAQPIVILTGGEPLLRPDIYEIAKYATERGLRVVVGTNGTVIDGEVAASMKAAGIARAGISIDFPAPELQDEFRGMRGAFDSAVRGIEAAQGAGIPVQINSTITKMNARYLPELVELALDVGAVAFHPFMLVPTGRGQGLAEHELAAEEYEEHLSWIYSKHRELGDRLFFKPTDAPHYMRICIERDRGSGDAVRGQANGESGAMNRISRGCLAGIGFCFISHVGRVQGCGYLDVEAGNLRRERFADIWANSQLFRDLRDLSRVKGKCGGCEFKRLCGGCRARAYEATGDYLEAEPYCVHVPSGWTCGVES